VINQCPVGYDIFKITDEHHPEENCRIYGFLTLSAIIGFNFLVKKLQIQYCFEPAVEIIFGNPVRKLERNKQFLLVCFLA